MRTATMVGAVVLVVAAIAVAVPRGSDHEDLVRRYESEVWTFPGNPAAAGEILSRDFVRYGPTDETSAAGLGAFGAYNQKVREIFPDLVCRVDGFFELGEWLGSEWTCAATHAETGKPVKVSGTSLYQFADGRITVDRASWDILDLARQIGMEPPLDTDQSNIALAKRLTTELYDRGNMSAAYEFLTTDFVIHVPAGGAVRGIEGAQKRATMFRQAFPDLTFTTHESIASGDTVATRWTFEGTHKGEFLGVAPTERRVAIDGISMVKVRDGKLSEAWGVWDTGEALKQLGATR